MSDCKYDQKTYCARYKVVMPDSEKPGNWCWMCLSNHNGFRDAMEQIHLGSKEIRLGDVVHKILSPVAKLVNKVFNVDTGNCSPCAERRQLLNKIVIKNG